jgi:hypothetical protein
MAGTVAELLAGTSTASPAAPPANDIPPPPPGFTVSSGASDIPPPPPGFTIGNQAPKRSVGDYAGMYGVRTPMRAVEGLSDLAQQGAEVASNPVLGAAKIGARIFGLLPQQPQYADKAADALGVATPTTSGEKLVDAGLQGAIQGVITGGAGAAEGTVAKMLGGAAKEAVAGAAAGVGANAAQQAGLPAPVQLAAGLAGGLVTHRAVTSVAERFGPKVADVVSEVPRDVAITPKGELTEDGREIAAQTGIHPDQVKAAYDHFDEVKARTANDNPLSEGGNTTFFHGSPEANLTELQPHSRSQAIDSPKVISLSTDPNFASGYAGDSGRVYGVNAYPNAVGDFRKPSDLQKVLNYYSAEAAKTGDGSALYPNKLSAEDRAQIEHGSWIYWENPEMWRQFGWDGAFNRELSGRSDAKTLNVSLAPHVRTAIEDEAAGQAAVNGSSTAEPPVPRPQSGGGGQPPETPSSAAQRLAEAQSEGVALTKGQATQDFTTQEQEQTLRRMAGTDEGAQAQVFYAKQQQQISDAVDRFKNALGNVDATPEERGAQVQDALRTLRDQGKAGVSALYKQAQDLAETAGGEGSNITRLDTGGILGKLRELFIDESVPDQVRKALKQQAAKYGLIGQDPTTVEGETTVKLKDQNGEPSGRISFIGPVEPLTISNAEAFRQKINALYETDTSKLSQGLKPVIDDAVQKAVERAATEGPGDIGKAFKAARAAHQQQQATFKAKDVVQQLVDWKKGAPGTPQVQPDAVLKKVLGNDADSVTNLKKVKAVLMSGTSDQSKAAWTAIQAHAVGKIFDKALTLNASADGPTISGAKLNSAIHAFGVDKLKVLLPPSEFDQLMKLRRIIGNATIPIPGTVNSSGTAYALLNFLGKQGLKLGGLVGSFVPGGRAIADVAAHVVKSSQQSAKAAKTLKGIREYDLTQAANEDAKGSKPDAGKFVADFIAAARDPNIVAPILAASSTQSTKDASQ